MGDGDVRLALRLPLRVRAGDAHRFFNTDSEHDVTLLEIVYKGCSSAVLGALLKALHYTDYLMVGVT